MSDRTSEFALAMQGLLDDTRVFKRKEWAKFLGVTQQEIIGWVCDTSLPQAAMLRKILDQVHVRRSPHAYQDPVESFWRMAAKSSSMVSPHDGEMGRSAAAYLIHDLWRDLGHELALLHPQTQVEFLYQMLSECESRLKTLHSAGIAR